MSTSAVEFIEPQNELIAKTGTGGLKQSTLDAIQARVENMKLDIEDFLAEKLTLLKEVVYSDDFISNQRDEKLMHDFLTDLVAFNVHIKLVDNNGLSHVSDSLLKFTERLDSINIDAYHVIRAHINALDAIMRKSLTDIPQDIIGAFTKELNDACDRYNTKYNGNLRNL